MPIVRPVVLSGGAGTRLWPLSNEAQPKQFLDLLGQPLFQATLERLDGLSGLGPATVVTGNDHLAAVEAAAAVIGVDLGSIIVEPVGRNTGPAVVAAALISDPDEVLVVLPADHVIGDAVAFRAAVARGVALAVGGALVTFGATPTRPETGFGYIELGDSVDGAFRVTRFKEKPGAAEAESLAGDGRHLWNSGMFVFTAGGLLEEVERHSPDLLDGVRPALPPERSGRIVLGPGFAEVVSISVDHAVMERTDRAVVIPIDVGWSDVGSWQSVWELSERDGSDNVLVGDVTAIEVTGSYVLASSRNVAVAGVADLVVVETPNAVLVVPRSRAQLVRKLAAGPELPD